jgi:glycosyltransferase involved in cell wall biosynthesis
LDGVSFIVTVFEKAPYLARVVAALAQDTGAFAREFVFVDDGSSDGSAALLARLTSGWPEPVAILRQENRGASAATNSAAARAALPWLRLVDGDDLVVSGATAALLRAARDRGDGLAYGDLGFYGPEDRGPPALPAAGLPVERVADGLARFIRNCPSNSSTVLVAADRFARAGGCDERLVSPDQALFLRLFASGGGVHLAGAVAHAPEAAPGRLSLQRRRSRYESVLALYYLVSETPGLAPSHARLACRRALSRAYRFHRKHGGARDLGHLRRFLASRLGVPLDPAAAIHAALGAFTEDGSPDRPPGWLPGALRDRERPDGERPETMYG